ncbi:YbjO family protein [Erwinia sp. V71]|uniref:YbjO family protein n=1 Tax=Erwinia sp. V71 TaxID=3369424 RepID=UPI003F61D8FF
MSDVFRAGKNMISTRAAIPVPVLIAGSAIIATRCLSVLLLANELGYEELADFVHRSAQAWDSTLIFIASQLIFFIELRCAIVLMRGSNRGRWGYVITQLLVMLYMLVASIGSIYTEIFSIDGDTNGEIIHSLLTQKFPDLLIMLLLFVPASSRKFFRKP